MSHPENCILSWFKESYKWWKYISLGVTKTPFKECLVNHMEDFKHPKVALSYQTETTLKCIKNTNKYFKIMSVKIILKLLWMTLIYSIKNLNWSMLVFNKVGYYEKVLKAINTGRDTMYWHLALIFIVLYFMCQYVTIR